MILDILEIQLEFFLHDNVDVIVLGVFGLFHQLVLVAKLDAGRVGDAGANVQDMHLFGSPKLHIVTHLGAGTDQAHIADKDIDQLWQFIKLELPDIIARTGDSWVSATDSDQAAFVAAHPHGAELEDSEILIVLAHSHLSVKHRAFGIELDPNGEDEE